MWRPKINFNFLPVRIKKSEYLELKLGIEVSSPTFQAVKAMRTIEGVGLLEGHIV